MKFSNEKFDEMIKEQGIVQSDDGFTWDNSGSSEVIFYPNDPNPLVIIKRPRFDLFRCYWCLNMFKDWDKKETHEETCEYHKRGESLQMVNT